MNNHVIKWETEMNRKSQKVKHKWPIYMKIHEKKLTSLVMEMHFWYYNWNGSHQENKMALKDEDNKTLVHYWEKM